MKEFEQSCFRGSILVEMGDGNLEKGIKTVNNEGWEIVSEYFDQATGETYYSVEREKIDL